MSKCAICCLFQLIVAVFFFGFITPAQASEGKPNAVLEINSYDFGFAYEGKDVIHDFIIKNTGDANLEIKAVKTT